MALGYSWFYGQIRNTLLEVQIVNSLFLFLKSERIFKNLYFSGLGLYMLRCQNLSTQLAVSDNYLGYAIRNILLKLDIMCHKPTSCMVYGPYGCVLYWKKKEKDQKRAEKKRKDGERGEKKIQCSRLCWIKITEILILLASPHALIWCALTMHCFYLCHIITNLLPERQQSCHCFRLLSRVYFIQQRSHQYAVTQYNDIRCSHHRWDDSLRERCWSISITIQARAWSLYWRHGRRRHGGRASNATP